METLESELVRDLQGFSDRFGDDQFCVELYRALTNRTLSKAHGPEGYLVLSWNSAEAVVNDLRRLESHDPLPLAETGGEGVVSATVSEALDQQGWTSRRLGEARPA
jgi:hypothetical protein